MLAEAATVVQVIEAVRRYGPLLKEIGVDLGKAYAFLRQQHGHPQLSMAELAEMYRIIETDPTKLGMGAEG